MNRPDMSQTNISFFLGVLLLAGISWGTRFSPYSLQIPFHREVGLALYGIASVFALLSLMLHLKRAQSPWKISPASVSISYIVFFVFSVFGIIVQHLGV